jgi:hypothetical protein
MEKALQQSAIGTHKRKADVLDWRKKISDHVAFALLVYTGLHIFLTMSAMKSDQASLMPYAALVVLVFAIIPGCMQFEARWKFLSDEQAADPELTGKFKRDCAVLWLLAIGLPVLLTGFFMGVAALS